MCIQQVASSTIRVVSAPDTPHFTFDAVVDMSVQQEGVFAGNAVDHACLLIPAVINSAGKIYFSSLQLERIHCCKEWMRLSLHLCALKTPQ